MEALGINLPGLVAQLINFTLLVGLLYFLLYKPILKMMDQRSARIKEGLEKAEEMKRQAAQAEEEIRKQLAASRQEGQALIAQAAQIAERLKREASEQARHEGENLIARARSEIHRERDEAVEELRRQFADLAILAAEKVIQRSLDKKAHEQLIDEVLRQSALRKE
ncbi:MAG: F0F1 ATP synthase subunit B [Chloroflexota bacterium]|nr:F0F1 ATP synthase subunit B [Chloroflexota bacterium]